MIKFAFYYGNSEMAWSKGDYDAKDFPVKVGGYIDFIHLQKMNGGIFTLS